MTVPAGKDSYPDEFLVYRDIDQLLYSVPEPGALLYHDELQALSDQDRSVTPLRSHEPLRVIGHARRAESTPPWSQTRPGLQDWEELVTSAGPHHS